MSEDETESKDSNDKAGVAFHPPVMLLALLLIGFALNHFVPIELRLNGWVQYGGFGLVFASLAFFAWSLVSMTKNGGSVPTGEPTDVIVSAGAYGYSRNPIYLSMVVLLAGVGVWTGGIWFFGLAVAAVVLLQWGVISREEKYLEQKFGTEYLAYKQRVRRWL